MRHGWAATAVRCWYAVFRPFAYGRRPTAAFPVVEALQSWNTVRRDSDPDERDAHDRERAILKALSHTSEACPRPQDSGEDEYRRLKRFEDVLVSLHAASSTLDRAQHKTSVSSRKDSTKKALALVLDISRWKSERVPPRAKDRLQS